MSIIHFWIFLISLFGVGETPPVQTHYSPAAFEVEVADDLVDINKMREDDIKY